MRRVDKYLDKVIGDGGEGYVDHILWKQVRDELAMRLTEKGDEVMRLSANGEHTSPIIREISNIVHNRVEDLLAA